MAIAPQSSTLKQVEAVVPTIRGGVVVAINNTEQNYTLALKIPANTTAEVSLPATGDITNARLSINGRRQKLHILPNGRIDCGTLGSGEWLIRVDY